MRDKVQQFGQWRESHRPAWGVSMDTWMLGVPLMILLSWLIGYWANAIYHMSFELESCWSGVAAIGTGLGSVAALATTAWAKYHTDSKYNSDDGNPPII